VVHGPDGVRHIEGASGTTPQPLASASGIALPTQPPLRSAPLRRRPGGDMRSTMVGAGTGGRPA